MKMFRFTFRDKYNKLRYLFVKDDSIYLNDEECIIKITKYQYNKMDKDNFYLKDDDYSLLFLGVRYLTFTDEYRYISYEISRNERNLEDI